MNTPDTPLSFRSLAFLLCTLALCGCAVGPDYSRPALPGKLAQRESAQPLPHGAQTAAGWWKTASDPLLEQHIALALADNRDLRGALARLEEARALRREAWTSLTPAGSVSAGYRQQLDSTVFFKGMPRALRDQEIFDLGVDAAWQVDLFGRLRRGLEATSALVSANEAEVAQLEQVITAETARAYIEYRTAQELLALNERRVALGEASAGLLRQQVSEGKHGREDLAIVDSELASLHSALQDLRQASRAAANRLGVLTGQGGPLFPAAGQLPRFAGPTLAEDPVWLLGNRADVQAAERRLAASTAAIGVARADYFPTLSISGRVGADANRLSELSSADANFLGIGPRLTWDLLSLHRVQARVRASEARSRQALAAWEQTVLLALEEIDNALARGAEAREKQARWTKVCQSAEEAHRIARAKAQEGLLEPRQLIAAEEALLRVRCTLVQAEAELAFATIHLHLSVASR